jgi:hypothetical protein
VATSEKSLRIPGAAAILAVVDVIVIGESRDETIHYMLRDVGPGQVPEGVPLVGHALVVREIDGDLVDISLLEKLLLVFGYICVEKPRPEERVRRV